MATQMNEVKLVVVKPVATRRFRLPDKAKVTFLIEGLVVATIALCAAAAGFFFAP